MLYLVNKLFEMTDLMKNYQASHQWCPNYPRSAFMSSTTNLQRKMLNSSWSCLDDSDGQMNKFLIWMVSPLGRDVQTFRRRSSNIFVLGPDLLLDNSSPSLPCRNMCESPSLRSNFVDRQLCYPLSIRFRQEAINWSAPTGKTICLYSAFLWEIDLDQKSGLLVVSVSVICW